MVRGTGSEPLNVLWLVASMDDWATSVDFGTLARSNLASQRLRVALPAEALVREGDSVLLINLLDTEWPDAIEPLVARGAVLVVSKFSYGPAKGHPRLPAELAERWTRFVETARAEGCAVVLDLCDNPVVISDDEELRIVRRELATRLSQAADVVTTSSEVMSGHARGFGAVQVEVIEDPVEGPPGGPRFAVGDVLRVAWFGNPVNLRYLVPWMKALCEIAQAVPVQLTLVTTPHSSINEIKAIALREAPGRIGLALCPWSPSAQARALEECDLVLIPSDTQDPLKNGVSANRLASALWAGRVAIASPLPSYRQLADFAWLGDDLRAGIEWCLAHPAEALAGVSAARPVLERRFSAHAVARQWRNVLARARTIRR